MHEVVEQTGMATNGNSPQIGLGRDRILVVAQLVARIRQQFHQRDANVGWVALLPIGHDERHAIENQPPETGVIFRQIIDLRRRKRRRRTHTHRLAVKVAGAFHLEGELYR